MTIEETKRAVNRSIVVDIQSWWPEIRIALISLLLLLSVVGFAPLSTRGEAREALVAFDMFTNHHFILPDGYGGEVPSKPPMLHWLISIVAFFCGMNEFATRAPSAIFAAGFIGCYFGILRRLRSDVYAWVAAGMLFFSLEWVRAATTCRVDLVHSSCLAAGWLCYFMSREEGCSSRWWMRCGCVAITGAFLSKGPVAVLLMLMVAGVWEFLRWRSVKTPVSEILSLAIWFAVIPCVVSLFWYGAAYLEGGAAFTDKFIEENLSRFSGTMKKPAHEHHWTYLIGTGLLGSLPWSLLVIPGIWKLKSNLKLPSDRFFRFSLLAAVVVFLFYSLPSSKRGVYLLASYPFWVIVALDLAQGAGELLMKCVDVLYRYLCMLIIALYGVVGLLYIIGRIAGVPFTSGNWERYPLFVTCLVHEAGSGRFGGVKVILLILPLIWVSCSLAGVLDRLVCLVPEHLRGSRWLGIKVGVHFSLLYLAVQGGILTVVGQQTSGQVFARVVARAVGTDPVVSYGQEFYSLSYYSRVRMNTRNAPFFFDEWVVLAKNDVAKLESSLGENQAFEVRASEPPGLKEGGEIVLGRIVRSVSGKGNGEKSAGVVRRY